MSDIRPTGSPGGSVRDRAAQVRGSREAGPPASSRIPAWLRAALFLPTAPKPMAHPDPHVVEVARHMARPNRRSPLAFLAALVSLSWLRSSDRRSVTAPAGIVRAGRSLLPVEPRRREVLAVLSLLILASIFSVTGPIAGAGSAPTTPAASSGDPLTDIADNPTPTPEPTPSGTLGPTSSSTSTPTARPTAQPTSKPAPTPKPVPKAPKVRTYVALGDSLTAWPSGDPWPSRLDALDSRLQLIHNAGVPGNTTAQMRARLNSDVYAYHPDVLFVLGGTNDLGLGYSGSAIIANLRAILVGAKSHKIWVILLLVPPDSYTSMAPKIKSLNTAIVNLARSQRVTYVDIHNPLTNSYGTYYAKYTSDGLHFSDLGAQVVANTVRARVKLLGL